MLIEVVMEAPNLVLIEAPKPGKKIYYACLWEVLGEMGVRGTSLSFSLLPMVHHVT